MMMTSSQHGTDSRAPGALDVTGYMCREWVPKPTPNGLRQIRRSPAPEILCGDPKLARAAIRIAPGQLKYRATVLSFAQEDTRLTDLLTGLLGPTAPPGS